MRLGPPPDRRARGSVTGRRRLSRAAVGRSTRLAAARRVAPSQGRADSPTPRCADRLTPEGFLHGLTTPRPVRVAPRLFHARFVISRRSSALLRPGLARPATARRRAKGYRDGAPRRERERLPSITAKAFGRGKSRAGRGFLVNPQPPEGAARPDGLLFGFVSARAMQEPPLPAPSVRLRGRRRLPRVVHSPRAAQWRIAPAGRFNVCSKVALRPGGGCRGRFHTSTNKGK